ncbi:MAG: NYN domain-containing protein [Candidatus Pacebacteria bacterium]|nr:NYN domain-containing protein [Candidatus Paceibacterota bacterium]
MIHEYIKGDLAVFIDASNIYHSQKTLGWKVDYIKLIEYLKAEAKQAGYIVSATHFYTGVSPEDTKQKGFLTILQNAGYIIHSKELKIIQNRDGGILKKGNLDVELTLDAYRWREDYRDIILFSGDSDFAQLVDLLKIKGKMVLVCSTRNHVSIELIQRVKFIDLDKLRGFIQKDE